MPKIYQKFIQKNFQNFFFSKKDPTKIIFKLDDDSRTAKFKVRKGNAGIIVGTGGWERETGEKTSLNIFFLVGIWMREKR